VTYALSATAAYSSLLSASTLSAISGSLTIDGVSIGAIASASSMAERAGQVVAAINNKFGETGVQAYISSGAAIELQGQLSAGVVVAYSLNGAGSTVGITSPGTLSATTTTGVSNLSVATYSASQTAIALVDDALSTVNSTRSTLGATQSRFESAVASQMTTAENLSASRSRIMDADFASETANLAKAQILQQSGIAMLAQANAIPQNVLALLQ